MPSLRHRIPRLLPVAIVAAASALALTGCEPGALAPTESPSPSTSAQPTPSPSGSAEPTPSPSEPAASETAEPTTPPIAGEIACSEVFTADDLYAFNPNFAPTSERGELPGTTADVADAGGTVCAYQHVTGSDRLVIAVLPQAQGTTGPAFETVGEIGVATTLDGEALLSVASEYFVTEQDAAAVLEQVAANVS
ncbi:hypothetical protein [Agrococcus sp. Marseille-P2731]|uniref:hypothetical protein n=1 Tax=Agrococcus sp. Marseille-P2731 TaxID=1841862 RepID=UPI0009301802|nr:hypothetical protein [Agrococcus sp. Marseille-P2731]